MAETVYRDFGWQELEREYSPSSMIGGNYAPYIERYVETSASARRDHEIVEDWPYGPGPDEVVDLYLPRRLPAPLHVYIHGGYWQELSHKDSAHMASASLAKGMAFAAVNYTLAPKATIAGMVDQCARALDRLAASASDLGIDTDRIVLSGHSAGAHLAAMLISEGATPPPPPGLRGVLLISGVFDLEPIRHTPVNDPLGLTAGSVASLSPLRLPPRVSVPVSLVAGERDTDEFRRQSRAYTDYLNDCGLAADYTEIPGRNHFDIVIWEPDDPMLETLRRWL